MSAWSTDAGRPVATRDAPSFTTGAYRRIKRSRAPPSPVDLNECQIAASASSTCGGTVAETARGSCGAASFALGFGFGFALVAVFVFVAVAVAVLARGAAAVAGFFVGLTVMPSGGPVRARRTDGRGR